MRSRRRHFRLQTLTLFAAGLGCAHAPPPRPAPPPSEAAAAQERRAWERASAAFARLDAEGRWDGEACREALGAFERVSDARPGQRGRAVYMMGLVADRCGAPPRAAALYQRALELEPGLCEARVALGADEAEARRVAAARAAFERAIAEDATCAPAYVNLAAIQASRPAEREAALANLRRALAVRTDYLPALHQLAQLYLAWSAERPALLDLAEVVCRQSQLIEPDYAPLYNTWALIDLAQGDLTGAAAKLAQATALDPSFYEAWMNFGQLTLSQRAYEDAARAFAAARRVRPDSYDAAIGEGVAMRGLARPTEAERHYRAALELDEDRPEAWYDLAVLYQAHLGGRADELERAEGFLREFVARARRSARFADEVEDVLRWCAPDGPSGCRRGRAQTIRESLALLRGEPGPVEAPGWIRQAAGVDR